MSEELYYLPLGKKEHSPWLHAMAVHNLLSGSQIRPVPGILCTILAFILLAGMAVISTHLAPFAFAGVCGISVVSLLLISSLSFLHLNMAINVSASVFAVISTYIFAIGLKYYIELSEKLRIRNAFQHYVSASVVNEILRNPEKLNLHGEERILSIFFSDITGFTTLAEGLPPMKVVEILNEYLTEMTDIIFTYEGLLDKYEGDAIMAVFGAPIDQRDHAIRSCRCALENQTALERLRQRWRIEGKPELYVRIGINTGLVVVGNMGSKVRFDYTVIGDNVNLASRLENANKVFDSDILVSETTAELSREVILSRKLGNLRVLGKKRPVAVFEVLAALDNPDAALLAQKSHARDVYGQALEKVFQRDFTSAVSILSQYLNEHPGDRPAKRLLSRCEGFREIPPPPEWDGAFVQTEK